jgi:hypothetical protein
VQVEWQTHFAVPIPFLFAARSPQPAPHSTATQPNRALYARIYNSDKEVDIPTPQFIINTMMTAPQALSRVYDVYPPPTLAWSEPSETVVQRGTLFLTLLDPTWFLPNCATPINLGQFNINNFYHCILGQRYGSYDEGLIRLGLTQGDAFNLGFESTLGSNVTHLQTAWLQTIAQHRRNHQLRAELQPSSITAVLQATFDRNARHHDAP